MKRLVLVLLVTALSFSYAKYCKISDGNRLHLICSPEDTKPIHVINDDNIGCENETEMTPRNNIITVDIATCTFDDYNLFPNFTELKFSFFHETKSLQKHAFIGMDQVKSISIGYSNAEVLDAAFSDLPNLRRVVINDNKLKLSDLAFESAHQLKFLTLLDWGRSSLPTRFFRDLNNLEYLSLGRHFETLSDIDFFGLENVKLLHLNMNHVKNLTGNSFDHLKMLKYLYLDYNRLSDIGTTAFSKLQNLIFLNLEGNQIQQLKVGAFDGLSSLRCLFLYNNYIRNIEAGAFSSLGNLKKLDLTNNRLTSLPENTFKGLVSLQYLSLRENSISTMDVNAFAVLPKLVQLDLSRQVGWPLPNLESIDLNAFPQFIDLQTKAVVRARINDDADDFEKEELNGIKDILSFEDDDSDYRFYKTKFFGSFELNKNDYPQANFSSLSNISQNASTESLIIGNLDLSDNPITFVNLTKN
ncbi:leucine-rich repeat-containing G-protein coupled receptor 4-like [Bradysia coprophila]|uniref:leucine-rich repeat-containing G-protein coupled receptor 4-like n=1 Tax=Bradysia coprophila TaxID=38358 RepID=UPI00187D7791|nr:leucine-rich repeat-containing G-protein coupled receptor 4-like [Bradysia coprophila]